MVKRTSSGEEKPTFSIMNLRRSPRMSPQLKKEREKEDIELFGLKTLRERICVGKNYQAVLPECRPIKEAQLEPAPTDKDLVDHLLWAPNQQVEEEKEKRWKYLNTAQRDYDYSVEQALGLLFYNQHNFEEATGELAKFTPIPEEPRELPHDIYIDKDEKKDSKAAKKPST